jgi:carbon-monoxide dehydrogenase medium subunit
MERRNGSMMEPGYFEPETIEEALSLAAKYKGECKLVSGGTDLLVQMRREGVLPAYVINIRNITGQNYINYDEKEGLRIGALATLHSIETSSLIRGKFNILAQAASKMATVQVRNQATIGGNLCNASPSADTAPALIVLGARVKIIGLSRQRIILLEDFFTGPGQTVLQSDEILAEVQVSNPSPRSGWVYIKQTVRKALDLAIVGVAVGVTMEDNIPSDVRIGLGAVAPTPIRARRAEEILRGCRITDDLLENVGQTAADESSPIDDVRSSADYRRKMVKVLVMRAMKQAVEQTKST